jgi:hypothetical protein
MGNELLIASFTSLLTITTLIIGKLIEIVFINPVQDLRKIVGEVAFAVTFCANVFPGTEKIQLNNQQELETAQEYLRNLASKLRSSAQIMPLHSLLHNLKVVPSEEQISQASTALIGWSNSLFDTTDRAARSSFRKLIIKELKIKYS